VARAGSFDGARNGGNNGPDGEFLDFLYSIHVYILWL